MPLVRADDKYEYKAFDCVKFAMMDDDKRIVCRVEYSALQDRSARDKQDQDAVKTFKRLREEIEEVASKGYDEGKIDSHGGVTILEL